MSGATVSAGELLVGVAGFAHVGIAGRSLGRELDGGALPQAGQPVADDDLTIAVDVQPREVAVGAPRVVYEPGGSTLDTASQAPFHSSWTIFVCWTVPTARQRSSEVQEMGCIWAPLCTSLAPGTIDHCSPSRSSKSGE